MPEVPVEDRPILPLLGEVPRDHVSGAVDQSLCSLVSSRLAGVSPCSLKVSNLNVSACGNTFSFSKCAFWEQCTYSEAHSFAFQGGTAQIWLCKTVVWIAALFIGGLLLLLGLGGYLLYRWASARTTSKIQERLGEVQAIRRAAR